MLLLVTTGHPDMARYAHPNLGRLIQPRHTSSIRQTADEGVPWAADNDCFQALNVRSYLRMVTLIRGLPGCRFVTIPDVVGDHDRTLERWYTWSRSTDQPPAFVLQDGCDHIPPDAAAVFIGGSTIFKLGDTARLLTAEAHRRGLWVHMGRVNSLRRLQYANSIGCHSVDGTYWARWKQVALRKGLAGVSAPQQLRLD